MKNFDRFTEGFQTGQPGGSFNFSEMVLRYAQRWPLFLLVLIITFSAAFIYLRFTVPLYEAGATVLIKDERKTSGINETAFFEDLGIIAGRGNLDDYIELLQSRSLMQNVVQKLQLHLRVFEVARPLDKDLYSVAPLRLIFTGTDSSTIPADTQMVIQVISEEVFCLKGQPGVELRFGSAVPAGNGLLTIKAVQDRIRDYVGKELLLKIASPEVISGYYTSRLKVFAVNNKANVIRLSLRDPVHQRAEDILNTLISEHRRNEIEDNRQVALNTSEFIKERMMYLNVELSDVESSVQDYKTDQGLVNLAAESDLYLSRATETERQLSDAYVQLNVSKYLLDHLQKNDGQDQLIPSNLGLSEVTIASQIDAHNKMVMDRSRLQLSSGSDNPRIINLNTQIKALRESIRQALQNEIQSLDIRYQELSRRVSGLQSRVSSVPKKEREFRELERQRQIKESLYIYLLQKREESSIALAVPITNVKVIDPAYSPAGVVNPNRKLVYSLALILGLVLPVGWIYLINLFNTRISELRELEDLQIPLAGEIPFAYLGESSLIFKDNSDRAALEAFRRLRTNLGFLLDPSIPAGRIIAITSSVAKEGKTFVSINLAAALAYSGKKVLVCGLDLRTPKLLQYLGFPEFSGFTNYLTGEVDSLDQLIRPVPGVENLFVLSSGDIPPNPSELLMKDKVRDTFEELRKEYDYVVIDTAPIGLVADAMLITSFADTFLYLVRWGFTDRKLLGIPLELYRDNRLRNMALVFNGAELTSDSYSYGYYGKRRKPSIWKRIFARS